MSQSLALVSTRPWHSATGLTSGSTTRGPELRSSTVWPAALAHGAFNASSPVLFVLVANLSSGISTPVIGWTGWLVLALTIAVLAGAGQYHWATLTADPPHGWRLIQAGRLPGLGHPALRS